MIKKIVMIVGVLALVGGVYYFTEVKETESLLARHNMEDDSLEEIVERLEDEVGEENLSAGIYGDHLEMSDHMGTHRIDIPSDKFYLSVAPYENGTHPCDNHNLTGCQGEMVKKKVDVTVVGENGETIYSESVHTYNNGFFGVWLPKDIKGKIYVNYGDKTAVSDIETYSDSPTCLSSMHLN